EAHGSRQEFGSDFIFCSFLISAAKTFDSMFSSNVYRYYPSMKFAYNDMTSDVVQFDEVGREFWRPFKIACDPDNVDSRNASIFPWRLTKIDASKMNMECAANERIIVIHNNALEGSIKSLICNYDKFEYVTDEIAPRTVSINETESFFAYCGVDVRTQCEPLRVWDCAECTAPSSDGTKATCPSDKWRLEDGSWSKARVFCNQSSSSDSERTSVWFRQIEDNVTKIDRGGCSTVFDCRPFSALSFDCPKQDPPIVCDPMVFSSDNKTLTCGDDTVLQYHLRREWDNNTLKCVLKSGLYRSPTAELDKKENVYCEKVPVEAQPATDDDVAIAVSICIFIALIIVAVIVAVEVVKYRRHKKV
ncbi:hypothetical protein PFISCL1PPCAC_281, partial [Pristionchus fissidentatus]